MCNTTLGRSGVEGDETRWPESIPGGAGQQLVDAAGSRAGTPVGVFAAAAQQVGQGHGNGGGKNWCFVAAAEQGAHAPRRLHEVAGDGGRTGVGPGFGPADDEYAVIARMHQQVFGRQVAMAPAAVMDKGQDFEDAPPQPHAMARIDAARRVAPDVGEAAPVTAGMAQQQDFAIVALRRAERLRQAAGEIGGAGRPALLQCFKAGCLGRQYAAGRCGMGEFEGHPLGQWADALGEINSSIFAATERREQAKAPLATVQQAPRSVIGSERPAPDAGMRGAKFGGLDDALAARHIGAAVRAGQQAPGRLTRQRRTALGAGEGGELHGQRRSEG